MKFIKFLVVLWFVVIFAAAGCLIFLSGDVCEYSTCTYQNELNLEPVSDTLPPENKFGI